MGENITNDSDRENVVTLGRCQFRRSAYPERGILMPSQDDDGQQILNILRELTPEYLACALALAKGAMFSSCQDISASPLVTFGK